MLSEKPWRLEAVLQFCAGIFLCFCTGALALALLHRGGVAGFQNRVDFGTVLLNTLSFQGAAWGLILIFLRQHHLRWRDAFGFRGPDVKRALLLAVVVAILILPVTWLLLEASGSMLTRPGEKPPVQAPVKLINDTPSPWVRAYLGLFAIGIVPVAEEFIFRGLFYPFIKRLGHPWLAAISVSIVFAAIHLDAITFLPLFVLAMALTWLYEKTDNLLAPILAHALFNAANFTWLLISQIQASPAQ